MQILLDMDGVLADFEQGFFLAWSERYPEHRAVPPLERCTFAVRDNYPAHLLDLVQSIYHSQGFFRSLQPIVGAIDGVRSLLALGHDVRICTTPLNKYRYCVPEKYEWLEEHFGADFVSRLIVTRDKTVVRADVLVDDNPQIIGALSPSWTHVVFDQPYNRGVPGLRMNWSNWRDVFQEDHSESTSGAASSP